MRLGGPTATGRHAGAGEVVDCIRVHAAGYDGVSAHAGICKGRPRVIREEASVHTSGAIVQARAIIKLRGSIIVDGGWMSAAFDQEKARAVVNRGEVIIVRVAAISAARRDAASII